MGKKIFRLVTYLLIGYVKYLFVWLCLKTIISWFLPVFSFNVFNIGALTDLESKHAARAFDAREFCMRPNMLYKNSLDFETD